MKTNSLRYDGNFNEDMIELVSRIRPAKAKVYTLPTLQNPLEEDVGGPMLLVQFDQDGFVCWTDANNGLSEEDVLIWPGPVNGRAQV